MKRNFLFGFVLSLIFPLFPLWSVPILPYDISTVISYGQLTPVEQLTMDELYAGVFAHCDRIDFGRPVENGVLASLMELLFSDFPELIGLDNSYKLYTDADGRAIAILPDYSMTEIESDSMRRELFREAFAIIEMAPVAEYQKELYFHDAICERVTYSKDISGRIIHTAYGALVNGDAVCDGYSKAMALLCRLAGIRCSTVTGMSYNGDTTGFHAWNIMYINDVCTLSDLTWNDYREYVRYDYFNVTDAEMTIDHRVFRGIRWPECTSYAVNWHRVNNLMIDTADTRKLQQLVDAYLRFTAETGRTISLRFTDYGTYALFKNNFQKWFNDAMKRYSFDFRYWVSPNDRQQCYAVRKENR